MKRRREKENGQRTEKWEKEKKSKEDEESCRTHSRKGGCGWHHWELFIPLYYTSALLFYEHFLPLRPRERRIQSYVFLRLRAENLRPVDRYLETRWRAPRQLSHRPVATSSANHLLLLLLLFPTGQSLFFHQLIYI